MREFIEFLKNEGIVQHLKKVYNLDQSNSEESDFINAIIEILVNLDNNEDIGYPNNHKEVRGTDIIGKIYESKISNAQKKRLGEVDRPDTGKRERLK